MIDYEGTPSAERTREVMQRVEQILSHRVKKEVKKLVDEEEERDINIPVALCLTFAVVAVGLAVYMLLFQHFLPPEIVFQDGIKFTTT